MQGVYAARAAMESDNLVILQANGKSVEDKMVEQCNAGWRDLYGRICS